MIVANRGGPLETVIDGRTGFLCEPTAEGFAAGIRRLLDDPDRAREMGAAGRLHVETSFSRDTLGARLQQLIQGLFSDGV